ncbi:MAG TPA: hypothetical protein PJ995_21545 [Cyclobacteriaceae bacterium]|nr:hypothetical protein [Cyclobacteriaceae bacterium]HMX02936.1 hypothetical protein [Cyclobacteriaceae bacterium]
MKTIGWIVVIALIVFCAWNCSKKNTDQKKPENDGKGDDGKSQSPSPSNPVDAILNQPMVKEKISEVKKVVSEKLDELKQSVPVLTSSIPVEKKIVIAEPVPVTLPARPGAQPDPPVVSLKQFKSRLVE